MPAVSPATPDRAAQEPDTSVPPTSPRRARRWRPSRAGGAWGVGIGALAFVLGVGVMAGPLALVGVTLVALVLWRVARPLTERLYHGLAWPNPAWRWTKVGVLGLAALACGTLAVRGLGTPAGPAAGPWYLVGGLALGVSAPLCAPAVLVARATAQRAVRPGDETP